MIFTAETQRRREGLRIVFHHDPFFFAADTFRSPLPPYQSTAHTGRIHKSVNGENSHEKGNLTYSVVDAYGRGIGVCRREDQDQTDDERSDV
jgi:hypothetical protein